MLYNQFREFSPKVKYMVTVLMLSFITCSLSAQNTVSPYSIFGPGELHDKGFGVNQGMGGAGVALKSGGYINILNPASLTGIDSMRIISEFGLSGKQYNLSSDKNTDRGFTANLDHIGIGFRYTSWLAGSIGVMPFSSVGYTIEKTSYVNGTESAYLSTYQGEGGISQFYFGNAVKLGKNYSFGANMSYMFGTLSQVENVSATSLVPELEIDRFYYVRSLYFDFGLQYEKIKDGKQYLVGLTYAPKQWLRAKYVINIYDDDYSVVGTNEESDNHIAVPHSAAIGFGIVNPGKYKLALDYTFQNWSDVEYPLQDEDFEDLHRVVFGGEINPWEQRAINPLYKNMTYRFGLNYERSYIHLNSNTIQEASLTLGVGIPLPGKISNINFSVTGGVNGTTANNLVQERFLKFKLGFSLNEIAFMRRTID